MTIVSFEFPPSVTSVYARVLHHQGADSRRVNNVSTMLLYVRTNECRRKIFYVRYVVVKERSFLSCYLQYYMLLRMSSGLSKLETRSVIPTRAKVGRSCSFQGRAKRREIKSPGIGNADSLPPSCSSRGRRRRGAS